MWEKILNTAAIVISLAAAVFTGIQACEARRARLDSEKVQEAQTKLADNAAKEAKRSADAAEKSADALLATARTFEATSQLGLEPNIQVSARFLPFGKPPVPPRILLWNIGPADAVALSVSMNLWVDG